MQRSQNNSAEPPGSIQAEKSPCVSGVSPQFFPGYSPSQGKVAFGVSDTAGYPELERRLAKLQDPPETASFLFWTLAQQTAPGSHTLLAAAHAPSSLRRYRVDTGTDPRIFLLHKTELSWTTVS